jgi:hypothetical protein
MAPSAQKKAIRLVKSSPVLRTKPSQLGKLFFKSSNLDLEINQFLIELDPPPRKAFMDEPKWTLTDVVTLDAYHYAKQEGKLSTFLHPFNLSRAYSLEEYKMENMYLLAHRDMGGLQSQAARGMSHISLLELQTDFLKEKFLRAAFNSAPTKKAVRVPLPAKKLEDYIAKKAIVGEGEVISTEYLHVNNSLRF